MRGGGGRGRGKVWWLQLDHFPLDRKGGSKQADEGKILMAVFSSGRGNHLLQNLHHSHHLPPQPKFQSFFKNLNIVVGEEVVEKLGDFWLLCQFESQLSRRFRETVKKWEDGVG